MSFVVKAKTAMQLGVMNLVRVIAYRVGIKLGLSTVRRLSSNTPQGVFFAECTGSNVELAAPSNWEEEARLFSYWAFPVFHTPPDWHTSPITGESFAQPERDWWLISDFSSSVGDIKLIWELSRFDWVLAFAQHAKAGNNEALDRLNLWINDWCKKNPPYKGPNWKCGQEASIRVMHLSMAALILGQTKVSEQRLIDLIELHLKRIAPTVSYAMAQDNNHGTSEAAALFIGGSWLDELGRPEGAYWAAIGRKWLENRAERLIGEDGSFSQYSLNYHRVMLDTYSMIEVWRRHWGLSSFSALLQKRIQAAAHWLNAMINQWNGDGPNIGANDGARLLQLTNTAYRDYRPSVQLATVLFSGAKAYSDEGDWDQSLHWLGQELPKNELPAPESEVFNSGGFVILCDEDVKVVLRYPRFRFRPSQADALHLDLWLQERNVLRDAGTYSYNTDAKWLNYFPGTEGHNTVQFDGRDQMPRLSRFLFGDWLKTCVFKPISKLDGGQEFTAGYKDRRGAEHVRKVMLSNGILRITDEISGFSQKAVLRWRLESGDWKFDKNTVTNGSISIQVSTAVPIKRIELVQGWESRYYYDKQPVPVLEVEVTQPGTLTTEFRWNL